jgi:hypothetical protein
MHDAADHAPIIDTMDGFASRGSNGSIRFHSARHKPALPSKPPNHFGELESQIPNLLNPIEYDPNSIGNSYVQLQVIGRQRPLCARSCHSDFAEQFEAVPQLPGGIALANYLMITA